ncbi:hypothetical protein GCM10018790_51010 [Kitasatospora xanthocidica]|nr:hypothetical protein GCM10018790_51010 [Kitasatospora xanthocidica]
MPPILGGLPRPGQGQSHPGGPLSGAARSAWPAGPDVRVRTAVPAPPPGPAGPSAYRRRPLKIRFAA